MAKEGKSRNTRSGGLGGAVVVGYRFTPANPYGNRAERRSAKKLGITAADDPRTTERGPDHGLPGDQCETFCYHTGEATHCPMDFTADGRGPMDSAVEAAYTACWCERGPNCPVYPRAPL